MVEKQEAKNKDLGMLNKIQKSEKKRWKKTTKSKK